MLVTQILRETCLVQNCDTTSADEERFFGEDDDDEEQPQGGSYPEHGSNGAMNFMPRTGLVDYDDDDDDDLVKGGMCSPFKSDLQIDLPLEVYEGL